MIDRSQDIDVEETCARLRKLLMETRGVGRREFIMALGQTLGGSALLSLLPRMVPDAAADVHALVRQCEESMQRVCVKLSRGRDHD